MSAIPWATTLASLDLALAGLPAGSPNAVIGADIRQRLNTLGLIYNEVFTPDVDAAKTAGDAIYTPALSAYSTALQTAETQADTAAKKAEQIQVTAQAGYTQPYAATVDGKPAVLAPGVSVPFAASELSTGTAALNLLHGSTPVLRVVAKDGGTLGNTVEATLAHSPFTSSDIFSAYTAAPGVYPVALPAGVATATVIAVPGANVISTVAFQPNDAVTLSVRRGASGYSETYVLGAPGAPVNVKGSALLASAEWFPGVTDLPDALGWTHLAGGAGGSLAAIKARLERAAKLPAVVLAGDVAALKKYAQLLDAAFAAVPVYPVTPASFPYAKRPAVTQFDAGDGTTYLVAGVKELAPGSKASFLSVFDVEVRLTALTVEADTFRALL